MIYIKAVVVGIAAAVVLFVLAIVVEGLVRIYLEQRHAVESGGLPVAVVAVPLSSGIVAAAAGLGGGFYWTIRRARRRRLSS